MKNLPVESKPKGRYQLKYRGTECTNCGHPLDMSDRFCAYCSQVNSTKKLTLKDFFDEFFSSLISYDSKLLKTLKALLLKPGKITREYLKGRRISYTNPFRFLLSLSIIYFLMLSVNLSSGLLKLDKYGSDEKGSFFTEEGNLVFGNTLKKENIATDSLIQSQIDSLGIAKQIAKKDSIVLSNPKAYLNSLDTLSFFSRFGAKREAFNTLISANEESSFEEIIATYGLSDSSSNEYAFNAATSYLRFKQRPGTFASNLISKLPFLVFFFLPVFALFIWVAYVRKKYTYTDHLIFGFHIQSLLFILLIVSLLIDSVFKIFTGWIFVLIFIGYLYKAMRNFYQQGRFKTIVKFAFLNLIFVILALLSIVILLTGSIYTF